jgi:hypothetical protein
LIKFLNYETPRLICTFRLSLLFSYSVIKETRPMDHPPVHVAQSCLASHSTSLFPSYKAPVLFLFQILTKLEFSLQILVKPSNVKFHEHPKDGNRFFPCGRTEKKKETDVSLKLRDNFLFITLLFLWTLSIF